MYLQNVFRRCFLTVLSDVLFLSDFPISKLLTDQIRSPFGISKTPIQLKFSGFFFFFSWEIKVRLLCEGGGGGDPHRALNIISWWNTGSVLENLMNFVFIHLSYYRFIHSTWTDSIWIVFLVVHVISGSWHYTRTKQSELDHYDILQFVDLSSETFSRMTNLISIQGHCSHKNLIENCHL